MILLHIIEITIFKITLTSYEVRKKHHIHLLSFFILLRHKIKQIRKTNKT